MNGTLVIDKFDGNLVRDVYGDINSGFAKYSVTNGCDPFTYPGTLYWYENPTQIDPTYSVITDLIMAGKERVESGVLYVYCVGHTGRVYKIQVNDPTTFNPSYDNPVLLTTLTTNSPTFTRGASLEFFGATERIYIGHDKGATRIDFDGTNETFVGIMGSWTQNVPRVSQEFIGRLYFANGSNLAEVDTTGTVTTYSKLSPAFPLNSQVRDMDVSTDGNYLEIVVSELALGDITSTTPDTSSTANSTSFIFKWNGYDTGYTSYDLIPSFSLTANVTFGQRQFAFGYDIAGSCVFNPTNKILTSTLSQAPLPNTVNSNANITGWYSPEFVNGFMKLSHFLYGPLDREYQDNWYRILQMSAQGTETDVIRCPFAKIVSNLNFVNQSSGYFAGVIGVGREYFSTLETSSSTTKYKFYKFDNTTFGLGTAVAGTYETQNNLFSKKVRPTEVRLYTNPLVSGNSFTVSLIGTDSTAIPGSSQTFTVGSNAEVGQDYIWYTPQTAPTYAIGLKVTNSGSVNWALNKAEIDYVEAGR